MNGQDNGETRTIVLAGGCFWCVEAVFEQLPGIIDARSGYAGGTRPNPTYEEVCTGKTGHAEAVRLTYNPSEISLDQILDRFFLAHDPTTPNRQGADVGTQYRSAVFYGNDDEKAAAERAVARAQESLYDRPIVTEIKPLETFYDAEEYHQDYYRNNPFAGYCSFVIRPKLKKLATEPLGPVSSPPTQARDSR